MQLSVSACTDCTVASRQGNSPSCWQQPSGTAEGEEAHVAQCLVLPLAALQVLLFLFCVGSLLTSSVMAATLLRSLTPVSCPRWVGSPLSRHFPYASMHDTGGSSKHMHFLQALGPGLMFLPQHCVIKAPTGYFEDMQLILFATTLRNRAAWASSRFWAEVGVSSYHPPVHVPIQGVRPALAFAWKAFPRRHQGSKTRASQQQALTHRHLCQGKGTNTSTNEGNQRTCQSCGAKYIQS